VIAPLEVPRDNHRKGKLTWNDVSTLFGGEDLITADGRLLSLFETA
jgi:hypothetical protein